MIFTTPYAGRDRLLYMVRYLGIATALGMIIRGEARISQAIYL